MQRNKTTEDAVYPNFLYIGGYKSGSSWIYEALREHPQVFVPPAKDIQFFDVYYDKGIKWYLSFLRMQKKRKRLVNSPTIIIFQKNMRKESTNSVVSIKCSTTLEHTTKIIIRSIIKGEKST